MTRNRGLLVPGIEAVGLNADRHVEIESDLHPEAAGQIPAGAQLPVGRPLHEFDEFDLTASIAPAQRGAAGIVRPAPGLRPLPPGLVEFVAQRLKTGKAQKQRGTLSAERVKILFAADGGFGLEIFKSQAKR